MATSTNYGWSEPDNTSLVKDGAQAIRTLGNAIDTSLWNSGYGQAGKNKIINGDFTINQRSFTSTTTNAATGFDRFEMTAVDGTTTYSAQTFTPGAAPVAGYEAKNYARLVSTGQTATSAISRLHQRIEDVRTFAGQTVTISFWAQAGTGTPKIAIEMAQNFGSGGSPSAAVNTYAGQVTLSTSFARYSVTVAIPSISGKTIGTTANTSYLQTSLWVSAGSDYNARTGSLGIQSNTFNIWGVQVEYGSTATPFQTTSGGSIQDELAMCQRYYQRYSISVAYFAIQGITANSTTVCRIPVKLPSMRIAPTTVDQSGLQVQRQLTDVQYSSGTWTIPTSTPEICVLDYTHGSAVFTAGETLMWRTGASGGYFGFSAEL